MAQGRLLLKNGTIIDGTGTKGYKGDLLIAGSLIEAVSDHDIAADAPVLDCTDKVVAPGFIDMHSHNDWFLSNADQPEFTMPFTEQGITTFVGGNCGFSAAGILKDSPHKAFMAANNLFKAGTPELKWDTMSEFSKLLTRQGLTHNLAMLAGHGTARTSVCAWDPAPLSKSDMSTLLTLLEQAMDEGAKGVSLGLQYAPGIFAGSEELKKVAELVKKKDRLLTVHMKAYSSVSGTYPVKPLGMPHNLMALAEILELAKSTGVRLQLSHLIFVGEKSWKTFHKAMEMIDAARKSGLDVMLDTYAYHCGASVITVLLPEWFMAGAPDSFNARFPVFKVRLLAALSFRLLGFGFEDIQIACANYPDLDRYNGMFLSDIARDRGMQPFDNYMDFVRKSKGTARVLMYRYSSPDIVDRLMDHPLSMYMTDAWSEPTGVQNPAAYGCFPKFLQQARDKGTMEAAVHKMTGASASRFSIHDRGVLEKGKAADITIFDPNTVKDNTCPETTDARPTGIDYVFINGIQVVTSGKTEASLRPGQML